MDYAQIAQQAAILIAVFAPASAIITDLLKRVIPVLGGEWAATIAGALSATATMYAIQEVLPVETTAGDWAVVGAIILIAAYSPKIIRDVARAPRKAADHIAMITEWDDDDQGEGA